MNFLVIGYGNSLRNDDGAGQKVAEKIARWQLPSVRALPVHQLTPELALDIAQVDVVIFVDVIATNPDDPASVQIEELQATKENISLGHVCDPRSLLACTTILYGKVPQAFWVLIPAVNFNFGEEFSVITQEGIDLALTQIQQIIDRTWQN